MLVDDADGTPRARPPAPRATSLGSTLAKPTRPASVSTSTSGSSQSIPREPLRTTIAPAASNAAATSSAPTETAAASPGTKTFVGRSSPALRQRVDALTRQPAVQAAVERARTDRARSCRGRRPRRPPRPAPRSPARPRVSAYSASAPDRLAGLASTERDGVGGGRARCGSPCRSVTTPCTSATERFSTSAIASTSSRATWPSSSITSWSTGISAPRSERCCVAMARTSATRSVSGPDGQGRHFRQLRSRFRARVREAIVTSISA